jgi:3-dehydroquinate synthase
VSAASDVPDTAYISLDVAHERTPYTVHIGAGISRSLPQLLQAHGLSGTSVVVSCPPVWRRHGRRLKNVVARGTPALMRDGERAKTLGTVTGLYREMSARRLDRSSIVIAFGGGVVGDAAGFAAASYLRGVTLVQVPTTLLSQVDSAIGGKVGVNLPEGKNLVGAFHPPAAVVCDPEVLATLSPRQFRAGMYEVVKYGVIASRELFSAVSRDLPALVAQDRERLTEVIAACCRIKIHVVSIDEREAGPRRALNFGHTVGHALEAATGYRRFLHGEAVGLGMLAAARLSVMRGTMSSAAEAELRDLIARLGKLPPVADLKTSAILEAITHDKKVVRGTLHFVLAQDLGATTIATDVTPRELKTAIAAIGITR